ncbi:MAG: polysaccharide export protein [Prevotellaceae bacterium]|jgi:polysaccharide export outer membrane protein|nr:polysaccharide export protein [Prevotellaceae bacterium]
MNNMFKTVKYIIGGITLVALCSCSSRNVSYFKDLATGHQQLSTETFETVIAIGDHLSIIVSGTTPEAVAVFNLPLVTRQLNTSQLNTTPAIQSYTVDVDGAINFPVLGKLQVAGLKKTQVVALIEERLKAYVADPIVVVQILNFKITVLGEVTNPGTYTIENERVTFLEALGLAGDMTIYGRRDNVLLIRENQDGGKSFVRIDIYSTDLVSSPYYYLQQNDVLYIEPNSVRLRAASSANMGIYLSAISTFTSTVTMVAALVTINK